MIKTKKKILYCITKGNWGGAQKYAYDLATTLPKDQYEVVVLLGIDGELTKKLQAKNIRTIVLNNLPREISLIKVFFGFLKLLKIFRQEKPDIIHLNSSKMGFLGAWAGRLAGIKKIIFTGHGWAFNEDRSLWQKKLIYLLHLLTIALAHQTIAVSQETKKQIAKNNFYSKKITVIKNGLEKIEFLDKSLARTEILSQGNSLALEGVSLTDRLWLGTISELHKNKGLKYLIEAIHLLDVETENRDNLPILIIIGEGERRKKLQERINRYNLQDTIFLIGQISDAKKYLKAFDIFTLTSITEALPYALLEAGQAGLPIIASRVGGIPEIIDHMENGILVTPREPEEIKKAISLLLKDSEKRKTLGQKIQEKVFKDFNKDKMTKETLALYELNP